VRALIIDDSKPVRSILAKMFRALDFDTREAGNGREALEHLRRGELPDVVTVNWQMPVMDGLDFIRAVRRDPRLQKLPLLMISCESGADHIARAVAAGANDYITKPCTADCLRQRLEKLGIASPVRPPPASASGSPASTSRRVTTDALRVMIVDDSSIVRRVLRKWLGEDPELEVVGAAEDGRAALDALGHLRPDVVLLDVEMPRLNGLETLEQLRRSHPRLPVIMFSSLTERGAQVTLDALFLGANDYVFKPGGPEMSDPEAGRRIVQQQLVPKIKQFADRHKAARRAGSPCEDLRGAGVSSNKLSNAGRPNAGAAGCATSPAQPPTLIAIAASTGGPRAIATVLGQLPHPLPVPILVVQHMPPLFTRYLADRLAADFKLDVREGIEGERLRPGRVRIAPGGRHMTVAGPPDGLCVQLNDDPPRNCCRPSADVLFESVARRCGAASLAVVLTGMGQDGLEGCRGVRAAGGQVVVQDEASSVVWGMPGKVACAGLAHAVLPLQELAADIRRRLRVGSPAGESPRHGSR
jgi:two-component system chemotaxis response regulator CheB